MLLFERGRQWSIIFAPQALETNMTTHWSGLRIVRLECWTNVRIECGECCFGRASGLWIVDRKKGDERRYVVSCVLPFMCVCVYVQVDGLFVPVRRRSRKRNPWRSHHLFDEGPYLLEYKYEESSLVHVTSPLHLLAPRQAAFLPVTPWILCLQS